MATGQPDRTVWQDPKEIIRCKDLDCLLNFLAEGGIAILGRCQMSDCIHSPATKSDTQDRYAIGSHGAARLPPSEHGLVVHLITEPQRVVHQDLSISCNRGEPEHTQRFATLAPECGTGSTKVDQGDSFSRHKSDPAGEFVLVRLRGSGRR